MPPICETKGHVTNLRSSHDELNCEAEKSGHSNQEAKNTISLEQKQKLAYDDNEIRILKTKKLLDDKNNQEKQVSVDHSVKRVSSTEPEKYNPKGLNLKDIDAYVDKLKVSDIVVNSHVVCNIYCRNYFKGSLDYKT